MKKTFFDNMDKLLSNALKSVEDNHNLDVIACKDLIMRALGELNVQRNEIEEEEIEIGLEAEKDFLDRYGREEYNEDE